MAVAVIRVLPIPDCVVADLDAAPELSVGRADAGVDDVGGYAEAVLAGRDLAVERQCALVDSVETPRGGEPAARPSSQRFDRLVLLY